MKRILTTLIALAALAGLVAGCGGSSDSNASANDSGGSVGGGSTKLNLVAYSTPETVYEALEPKFAQTSGGKGVGFQNSFGASGSQSRAVDNGQPADVVAFSLEPDITRLVKDNIVAKDWANDPYKGIVSDSIVALAVRPGNPKGIKTWDDLLKPGVQVVTPNPFTSGGARWNIMAAYGAWKKENGEATALKKLTELLTKHVVVQDASASDALNTFSSGKGDALITYESDAYRGQSKGVKLDIVRPDDTILIETPIAATSNTKHPQQAAAFVKWTRTPDAQKVFAENGYRPVVKSIFDQYKSKFPTPSGLFTIASLGGWSVVKDKFFDPDSGIVAKIEKSAGVSVASG